MAESAATGGSFHTATRPSPFVTAMSYTALGQRAKALAALQQSCNQHEPGLIYLKVDPSGIPSVPTQLSRPSSTAWVCHEAAGKKSPAVPALVSVTVDRTGFGRHDFSRALNGRRECRLLAPERLLMAGFLLALPRRHREKRGRFLLHVLAPACGHLSVS